MSAIKDKLKDYFFKYAANAVIVAEYLVAIFISILVLINVPTPNGDNVEHIHSSFLIASGNVPYKDFFQHHNPLMWFIFAPLTLLFKYNATISEVVSFISFLVFLKSLIYVNKIVSEFLGNKIWGVLAALFILVPDFKIYAIDFRPDNYMVFCLMGGIYYYFSYLRDKKTKDLCGAFVWFAISFLFAQKAVFPLFVLGLTGIYFWYKKEIKTGDMLKALGCALVIFGVFLGYLLKHGILELYYVSNYTFNLNLEEAFEFNRVVNIPVYMKIWVGIAFLSSIYALFTKNRYALIVALLFVTEFLQRKFYFSPYSYYYWMMLYFAVITAMPLLVKLDNKNRIVRLVLMGGLGWFLYGSYFFHMTVVTKNIGRSYLPDHITRNITPCDYVFNGNGLMYNIFGKDPHYYWQLIGQLDVVGEKTGIYPKPNMNELIVQYKPRFIYGMNYFNKLAEEKGMREIVHYIDQDLINTYYKLTNFAGVYELKDEYLTKCDKL